MSNELSWEVIDTFFKDNNNFIIEHHLSSYNNFFLHRLNDIFRLNNPILFNRDIDEETNIFKNNCKMYLGGKDGKKIHFGKPIIYDSQDEQRQHFMYPNEARLRNMTYAVAIHYDIDVEFEIYIENESGEKGMKKFDKHIFEETLTNIYLGRFPIMLGSDLCILNKMPTDVRFNMGECRNDPGGYFIIDGKEKIIVSQESRRDNILYVLEGINDEISHSAEIKSVSEDPSKPRRKLSVFMNSTNNTILVNIPNVRKPIPFFIVMRALGVVSDKAIIETCLLDLDKHDNFVDYFIPSVHESGTIFTKHLALKYISTFTKHKSMVSVLNILSDFLLPHIGELNFKAKAYYLGYMAKRLLMVYAKVEKPTDRDSYRYKRLEVTGSLIEQLFTEYYNLQLNNILKKMDYEYYFANPNAYGKLNFKDILMNNRELVFADKIVESGFKKAFKGNWGATAHTKRPGVLQELNRLSFFGTICQLRKTNMPISAEGAKVVGPRLLNATQWGLLCPLHSPDGGNVGLHNHLSSFTHITKGESNAQIVNVLKKLNIRLIEECSAKYLANSTKIFVNGMWFGNTQSPVEMTNILKIMKRNNLINIYTSILFDIKQNEILISTDAGRPCRPLFYKNNDGVFSFELDYISKTNVKNISWKTMIHGNNKDSNIKINMDNLNKLKKTASLVEYIDTQESENIIIESQYNTTNITHKEIHPSSILGYMANQIIFPENNPYPRNAFSCGQAKQAVSMYHSNFNNRLDKTSYVLNNGQVPITKSRYLNYITKEEHPYGENAIVAIMCYSGYNVEDAIIVNEGSLRRGMFNTSYYNVYETHEVKSGVGGSKTNSRFMNIKNNNVYGLKMNFDYSLLDEEHGIIREGSVVTEKTVLIGMAVEDPDNVGSYIDASITPKKGQIGIVDKAFITVGEAGERIAKVRIRAERIPEIGDKFCSRAGQKGTIGMVLAEQDMPTTKDGIRPDIIVNPHAMPSRMTVGHLVESLVSKTGSLYGYYGDCTAFVNNGPKHKEYGEMLMTQGFHSSGNEILYNGMTGEQIDTDIYIGPTYYLRLKHMPKDKINYRARGPRTVLTRQTVGGRANNGGLRIGEMDRDCLVAHGLNNFLTESMMERGDKYFVAICNKTGCIAIYNENKNLFLSPQADGPIEFIQNLNGNYNVKNVSKHGRDFSVISVPYSFKLLMQELQAMNIQMRIITDKNITNLMNLNTSNIKKITGFENINEFVNDIKQKINKPEKAKIGDDNTYREAWITNEITDGDETNVPSVFANAYDANRIKELTTIMEDRDNEETGKFMPQTPEFGPETPEGSPIGSIPGTPEYNPFGDGDNVEANLTPNFQPTTPDDSPIGSIPGTPEYNPFGDGDNVEANLTPKFQPTTPEFGPSTPDFSPNSELDEEEYVYDENQERLVSSTKIEKTNKDKLDLISFKEEKSDENEEGKNDGEDEEGENNEYNPMKGGSFNNVEKTTKSNKKKLTINKDFFK